MRYGIVIIRGAGEGGGDEDDTVGLGGADALGPGRSGEGLRYLRVKTNPGRVETLLSTQVNFGFLRCLFGSDTPRG